ncbi:MAG: hypothetical protein ACKVJK_07900 [Methylophagaceae bacterium]|jgi:hypothetical protein|tara:strand:+ start:300 stop:785 length:486 start_codon:yes stop_codon:yes gene_type:complete
MIFGSGRDFNLLVNINRELLHDVIAQEVLYHKLSIEDSETNLYGESMAKSFWNAVKLNCLITRGDQVIDIQEFGPDLGREAQFAFLRPDLEDINVLPEVGDIVQWQEDFYEVDTVRENTLFLGRDSKYNLSSSTSGFGSSLSIIVDCHLTRADKVGISTVR